MATMRSSLERPDDEADLLRSIKEAVQGKMGLHWVPGEWTPFMDRVALELQHVMEIQARSIGTDESDESDESGSLITILIGALTVVMAAGLTTKAIFKSSSTDSQTLMGLFLKHPVVMELVGDEIIVPITFLLFKLRPRLFEGDLVALVTSKLRDERRESLELENKDLPPEFGNKDQPELGSYLKFVNRDKSINLLLRHASQQYKLYLDENLEGNSCWAACSGGPGLGKTTFCRKAFTRAAEVDCNNELWDGVLGVKEETKHSVLGESVSLEPPAVESGDVEQVTQFNSIVKACVNTGRQYRLSFSDPLLPYEERDPPMGLAWRLAQAITKKKIPYPQRLDGLEQLQAIVNAVTKGNKESFVVINFDETNKLLDTDTKSEDIKDQRGREYLRSVSALIRDFNKKCQGFVFCIFSGTYARPLHDLLKASSGGNTPLEIPLPLLGTDHVFDVLNDLILWAGGEGPNSVSRLNQQLLEFVLEVLGGVPRYIEMLVFALCKLGQDGKFAWSSFCDALTSDDGENNVCTRSHHLLERVRENITIRYDAEFTDILASIPTKKVLGYSLFERPVTRVTKMGDYKVEDMERNGVVFLQSVNGNDTNVEYKLVFPLVLLFNFLRQEGAPMLLQDFRVMLSSEESERNSLMMFALKAEILEEIYGCVKVGKLLPLDGSNSQKFKDIEMKFLKFTIEKAKSHITKETWDGWFCQLKDSGGILLNAKGAPFADMIMIGKGGNFAVYFQEKQSENAKRQKLNNLIVPNIKVEDVQEEHAKCQVAIEHMFVMITDKGVEDGTELAENELLLTHDIHREAFGSLFTLLRAYNHHGQEKAVSLKRRRESG